MINAPVLLWSFRRENAIRRREGKFGIFLQGMEDLSKALKAVQDLGRIGWWHISSRSEGNLPWLVWLSG